MPSLLTRAVVPERLALIGRGDRTIAYNPALNIWHAADEAQAGVLRWLRAGRDRGTPLLDNFSRRFGCDEGDAARRVATATEWALVRRLLYLDGPMQIPPVAHPEKPLDTVYWIATQSCNLRCTYCYQDAMVARPHELSTAEARRLIEQSAEAGARTFIFTGGEPFGRTDLLELAGHSKRLGLQTNVITNGHYIGSRNVEEIARTFDLVSVSLDHGRPELHDKHRGRGSWRKSMRAIELLLGAGAKVNINSVLSKSGLASAADLLRLGRAMSVVQHKIVPQFPMGRGAAAQLNDELDAEQLIALADELEQAASQLTRMGVPARSATARSSKGSRRDHCGAGLSEISVDPEGWVYPCKLLQYPELRTQNVREASVSDIYAGNPILKSV